MIMNDQLKCKKKNVSFSAESTRIRSALRIKTEWRKHLNIFNRMVELIFNKATL